MRWQYELLYLGDPRSSYALERLNDAGKEGWEAIYVFEHDALVKRPVMQDPWASVPPDLSINVDHYLYGAKKRTE
jgi:hypothetical protein